MIASNKLEPQARHSSKERTQIDAPSLVDKGSLPDWLSKIYASYSAARVASRENTLEQPPTAQTSPPATKASTVGEMMQRVQVYRTKRQVGKAIELLKFMMKVAPNDPVPPGELADLYISLGMLEEGLGVLRTQVELYMRSDKMTEAAQALQRIAEIYWDMGSYEESLSAHRQVVQIIPEDMQARIEVVIYCLQAGLRGEAAHHQSVIVRNFVARDQTEEAVAALQQLIALDPFHVEAYDLLGSIYAKNGEYDQALRVYRNLAQKDPNNHLAHERIHQLQQESRKRNR